MAKRMLVDATHPEETRVAVVNGNRLEDLDFEIATRKQLKGNIYLAKVTRVEPSLQAAFVEYGGNRHGFLAFSEIHPDYYRIPIADREALLAEERRLEEQAEARAEAAADGAVMAEPIRPEQVEEEISPMPGSYAEAEGDGFEGDIPAFATDAGSDGGSDEAAESDEAPEGAAPAESPDVIGGDEVEEAHRRRARPLRSYKIQEVIKRRQVMLVQVTKEERGNKGAALTTYLSLPGRYCVLMPNTGRGGGISRKITNPADRKRLKEILSDLDIPEGMAVILRTAGLERSKQEIKRDLEYLLRLWDDIRVQTLKSSAPCLIYEEANLIKRSIRDLYTDDIDEIWVEGSAGFNTARDFMRMMMPSHTKRVMQYQDDTIPLFHRYQVETQIDAIHSPVVQLRSGGYIVINPTEALVSIDVNSGKSTRERNIEETAYKTNLEAADEVARQLRLRDLAGLIVIDFIDMEEPRNNAAVERRLKEAMKNDRARIQLGRISAFGLLELSRQRLRPSLLETNFERCPHCSGTGVIRSVESASLHVLRAIEEEGIRKRSSEITVFVPTRIALYILNQKRGELTKIEDRYRFRVMVQADDTLIAPDLRLERVKARTPEDDVPLVSAERVLAETDRILAAEAEEAEEEAPVVEAAEVAGAEVTERADAAGESEGDRRRRRRRRRGRGRDREDGRAPFGESAEASDETTEGDEVEAEAADADADETAVDEEAIERAQIDAPEFVINDVDVGPAHIEDDEDEDADLAASEADDGADAFETNGDANGERKKRRRGKRGGRRRSRQREGLEAGEGLPAAESEDGVEGEAEAESFPTAAEAGRAVNPPELPADMEPVEFDWVLTSAVAEDNAAEAAPETAAEGPSAEEAAPVAEEAPARKPRRGRAKATAAEAAETVTAEPEAAPAKPKRAAKGTKAAAKAAAPEETAPPPAKPSRSRKAKTALAEAAPAPAPVAAPVAEEAKKRPARKRKTAAEAPAEAAPAPAPVADPVAEEAKKRPVRKRKTMADAPAEAAPAPAVSEAPAAPADAPANEPASASAAPGAKPRRGWWSR